MTSTDIKQLHNFQDTIKNLDIQTLQKMFFVYNALETGWVVKKNKKNIYSFKKQHNDNNEFFTDDYITTFIKDNINIKTLFSSVSSENE